MFTGCKDKTAVEKTVDNTGDAVKQGMEKTGGTLEKAGNKLKEAAK
jgi:hypothetical protein